MSRRGVTIRLLREGTRYFSGISLPRHIRELCNSQGTRETVVVRGRGNKAYTAFGFIATIPVVLVIFDIRRA